MPTSPKASTTHFAPFVPASDQRPEFTFRAIFFGIIFGIIFGAVTVYVGLRAGLTVAASIPISVLSISILRVLGRASILENNIVQSAGNAGQSIAAGVIFTLPALIFLGFSLEYFRIFMLALLGGWLGVLFMIPLRRQLIVEEHNTLTYPEGTACADVLIAGERGGGFASRVFLGLGLGALYTLFQNENLLAAWPGQPDYQPDLGPQHLLKGAAIRADATPEYLGVGYIIGPKVAGVLVSGGIFSWLVLMPAIYFFGSHFAAPIYPGTVPIAQMGPSQLWSTYIRPMGAGAVAAAGILTLLRTAPTILRALAAGARNLRRTNAAAPVTHPSRTDHDLPMSLVLGGSVILVIIMFLFLYLHPVPGAQVGWVANLLASLLVVVFGFLFVTVSSRIVGLIGSSANPISGMTIATLMATAAVFLVLGWTTPAFGALAITIGGTVCIAAANAGDTSQDLKTGYIIGATPWKQQLAVMIGVIASVLSIGFTLNLMNTGLEEFRPANIPYNLAQPQDGVTIQQQNFERQHIQLTLPNHQHQSIPGSQFVLLNALGSHTLADGKYLYNPATHKIEVQWVQGIGSEKAAAPQGRLMATVINGILTRQLPWSLVLLGVALVIAVELLGIRSLSFAVGAYLSIATTLAIFVGGLMRWLVDRAAEKARENSRAAKLASAKNSADTGIAAEIHGLDSPEGIQAIEDTDSEISPGALYSSGLIAAGGIIGLLGVAIRGYEGLTDHTLWRFTPANPLYHDWVAVLMFALLAGSLYYFARKPMKGQ